MKIRILIFFQFVIILLLPACKLNVENSLVTIENKDNTEYKNILVSISEDSLKQFNPNYFKMYQSGIELPYQIEIDEFGENFILISQNLMPGESKEIEIESGTGVENEEYKDQTYAELAMKTSTELVDGKFPGDHFEKVFKIKVPAIHKDHDALFKYEGPGWESELVGYRIYLDQRNATDIFGKTKKGLFLEETGIYDTLAADDSYHNLQHWGMDIFNVGGSLGIGSYGMFVENKVEKVAETDSVTYQLISNGPLKSEIQLDYFGWKAGSKKYNLKSNLSINAGSRLTKCDLQINGNAENIVTGLVKHTNAELIKKGVTGSWSYIALYGKQTLNDDSLGIALFYNQNDLINLQDDDLNHLVILKPDDGKITYYFCAAWEKEPDGISTREEFVKYINYTLKELDNKVLVKYN